MSKRSLLLSSFAVAVLAAAPGLYASSTGEYVYVESNLKASGTNSIYAFERQTDGSLAQIPGSPFLTGGAGVQDTSGKLGPYDSDQDIIVNAGQSLLFAVNSGSDTIAVFHIGSHGSLTPVDGSPFPSGGTDPVSLGLLGNELFVANQNGDFPRVSNTLPNYTTFRVLPDGALVHNTNPGSTARVALGSSPSQALVAPSSGLLFGADFLGGLIQRFDIHSDGSLGQRPPKGLPISQFPGEAAPPLPLGLITHPSLPILYVGFVTDNKLSVYTYDDLNGPSDLDYGLRFVGAAANTGKAICWLRTNHSGTRLYSTDTITNSVSVYDLSNPYKPIQLQNLVLTGQGAATQFALSGSDAYLYAISSGAANNLHILKIGDDGTIDEISGSPISLSLPTGTRAQGVAVVTR